MNASWRKEKKKDGLFSPQFVSKLLSAFLLFQPTSAFFILLNRCEDKDFWTSLGFLKFIYKRLQSAVFPKTHAFWNSGV